jgi:hypothetical protein
MITWEDLAMLEPALNDLLDRARIIKDEGGRFFCPADEIARDRSGRPSLQWCLDRLVGWHARRRHPLLITSEAWDLALRTILESLPPCRGCGCILPDGSFA